MGNQYRLIVDSSCDLPLEMIQHYNIGVCDLIINVGERVYRDRKDITASEILKMYDETQVLPNTSALNIPELEEMMSENLKEYDHIFFMPISSKISSIYNNAHLAAQDLQVEDKVTILDSASLSSGTGLEALAICRDIQAGLKSEVIEANHVKRLKKIHMSFVIQTMEFLYKGGRCSGITYLFGNTFHLHPIILLDEGKMGVHTIVRGKDISKGVRKMLDDFLEQFNRENIDLSYPILIPHVEGDYGVKKIEKELEPLLGEKILHPIDASGIICCHCGRDTVGLAYMLKKPV